MENKLERPKPLNELHKFWANDENEIEVKSRFTHHGEFPPFDLYMEARWSQYTDQIESELKEARKEIEDLKKDVADLLEDNKDAWEQYKKLEEKYLASKYT